MDKTQTINHLLSFYQDLEFEERVFTPTDDDHEAFTEYYDAYRGRWTPSKRDVVLGMVMRDLSTALTARTSTPTST